MDYLTVSEAAEVLQLSVPTIKRYIYEGKLKSTKLPGGQHRIARAEIDRLLAPERQDDSNAAPQSPDTRLDLLERWMTDMQAELERLGATLEVLGRYLSQGAEPTAKTPGGNVTEILVLGPGCQKCNMLHERTMRILEDMGCDHVVLRHVTNLDDIAAFGPILTPALVIGGQIIISGRVPTDTALRQLLTTHLS